jgi:hypothetical protein
MVGRNMKWNVHSIDLCVVNNIKVAVAHGVYVMGGRKGIGSMPVPCRNNTDIGQRFIYAWIDQCLWGYPGRA